MEAKLNQVDYRNVKIHMYLLSNRLFSVLDCLRPLADCSIFQPKIRGKWCCSFLFNQGCHGEPEDPNPRGNRLFSPAPFPGNQNLTPRRGPHLLFPEYFCQKSDSSKTKLDYTNFKKIHTYLLSNRLFSVFYYNLYDISHVI